MTTYDTRQTVSLAGLFIAAGKFLSDFRHTEVHNDLSFICHHGSVQLQVCRHAGAAEFRRDLVDLAARILDAPTHVDEHVHEHADPSIWGTYIAHGTYLDTPMFAWTAVSPSEATRLGWGNVAEPPLADAKSGGAR